MEALDDPAKAGTQGGPSPQQQADDSGMQSAPNMTTGSLGSGSNTPSGYVLVGRSLITTLMPPDFRLASQLSGANIVSSDGEDLGEIGRMVIDAEHGNIAYVLVAEGGFLGSGENYRAVPLQALTWHAGETFILNINAADFAASPRITSEEVPATVRRGDVERLYDAFGLKPYWQAS